MTPSDKNQGAPDKPDEPAWGEAVVTEDEDDRNLGEFTRQKGLSKSKRVKSYLQKKCKDVETRVRSRSKSGSRSGASTASWYVCTEDSRTEGGTVSPEYVETPTADSVVPPPPYFPLLVQHLRRPPVEGLNKAEDETTKSEDPLAIVSCEQDDIVVTHKSNEEDNNSDTASEGTLLDENQQDEIHPLPQVSVIIITISWNRVWLNCRKCQSGKLPLRL